MPNTQDLVTKITNNTVEAIEINEQIACSISKPIPGLDDNYSYTQTCDMGNNQIAMINSVHHGLTNICIFDLSTKTIVKKHTLKFTNPTSVVSAVPLENKNYIALGDCYGKLLILDLTKMEITATHQIGQSDNLGQHSVYLRRHNGLLYGITTSSYSPGRVFFSAPAIPTLTPKVIKVDKVSSQDVALDAAGYAYFPYGYWANLSQDWHYEDNPTLYEMGSTLHLGTDIKLIQPKTGDSYLVMSCLDKSVICIFKGGPERIFFSYLHASLTLPKERIYNMEVLSETDRLLLVQTDKTAYIYDLKQCKIVSKFPTLTNKLRVVSNDILFFNDYDRTSKEKVSILTTHKLQEANALSQVFDALQNNHSVKQVTISQAEMDAASLRSLQQLKIKRPELKIVLPPSIENIIKEQEAEKTELRTQLSTSIAAHKQTLATKTQELTSKKEQYDSLKKDFETLSKENKEQKAAHEQQIKELSTASSSQTAEHQQQIHTQEELIFNLKKELSENQSMMSALQEELSNITQAYSEAVTLLAKPVASKSLMAQIEESKESLSSDLLTELVKEETNLGNISLIRWSEQKEISRYQHTLRQKGALLSVSDLLKEIKKIEPPHNEKQKVDLLLHAAQQLTIDYDKGTLPRSVEQAMTDLIVPEIEKDIGLGEPGWLRKLYLIKANEIKMALKKEFFSSHYSYDASALKEQFDLVVQDIAKNEEYALYHEYLNDGLLEKIRNEQVDDECFNQLVDIIKEKMSFNRIQLTEPQHAQALKLVMDNLKPEMVKLIHHHVIQYWEKVKQSLNPLLSENMSLKTENAALKQQLGSISSPLSPTRSGAAFFAQSPATENEVVNTVANGLN